MTTLSTRWALVSLVLLLTLAACSQLQPPPRPQHEAGAEPPPKVMLDEEHGQLAVFTSSLTTDGRNMFIRGKINNPYPEAIDGMRIMVRLVSGDGAREYDRFQRESDTVLAPGETTALREDIASMYAATEGRFLVQAYAKTRGGKEVAAPPDWRE